MYVDTFMIFMIFIQKILKHVNVSITILNYLLKICTDNQWFII